MLFGITMDIPNFFTGVDLCRLPRTRPYVRMTWAGRQVGFEANQAARKDAVDMKNHQWLGRHLVITPQNPWGLSSHGLRCLRQSEMCNVTCHLCFWTAQSGHHLETCEAWWNGLRKALFFMFAWSCQTGVRRQSGNALGFSCTGPWDDHSLRPPWPPAGALGVLRLHCNIRHIRCRGGTTEDNC